MKMENDKELDDLFKKGLENPDYHPAYRDDDWGAMEQMLNKQKKRPLIIYWLPVLSSVAALVLLFIGWWLFRPAIKNQQQNQQAVLRSRKTPLHIAYQQQKNPGKSGGPIQRTAEGIQNNSIPANFANTVKKTKYSPINKLYLTSSAGGDRRDTVGYKQQNGQAKQPAETLTAFNGPLVIQQQAISAQDIAAINIPPKANKGGALSNKTKVSQSFFARPQFALSVLGSSNLNGVNSLSQSKSGNTAGLLFSAGLKKFTISTGIVYTAAPYSTDFANYHTAYQFPTNPTSVYADCHMLDIPINFDYQIYGKHRNKLSVGTGISSYIMLRENYQFNYASNYGVTGPANFDVPHPDKYLLSIVNLQATYQRQINSKFSLAVQPYMKLPISSIGVSQVRLQTTGVAVGLSWNINSLSKP